MPENFVARRDLLRMGALATAAAALPAATNASCILLWQGGGASHLDTFDVKPDGLFRPIATRAGGVHICEHLPRLARQMHHIAVLRGMTSDETNHERATRLIFDGLPQTAAVRTGESFGEACLVARRRVQQGERFVVVEAPDFDTHRDHFRLMREEVLPAFDRGFAALLEDLVEHGLLGRTLVVCAGEFGRSPRINAEGGRDHHAAAWSVCLAGAGIRGGRALGATDRTGSEVVNLPVSPADLTYTICAIMGVTPPRAGRMIPGLLS